TRTNTYLLRPDCRSDEVKEVNQRPASGAVFEHPPNEEQTVRRMKSVQTGIFLLLVVSAFTAIGCGGHKSTTSSSSPNPTPTPTTSASSGTLTATPSSLGFGSQVLNTSATQTVKITNTGSTAVTITQDTISGSGFSIGITTPLILNAGQSVSVP